MLTSDFIREVRVRVRHNWKLLFFILIPIILSPIAWAIPRFGPEDDPNKKFRAAYVIALMGLFWIFEVLPLAATALFPLVLFPLMDVDTAANISKDYMKESNMIFLGGIVLALAIEYCGLHIRLALQIINIFGTNPARLMLGTMIITGLLAMWLSDSSCTTMLLPVLMAVTAAMFREEHRQENIFHQAPLEDEGWGEGPEKRASVTSEITVRRQSVVFANSAMQSRGGTFRRRSRRSNDKPSVTPTPSEGVPEHATEIQEGPPTAGLTQAAAVPGNQVGSPLNSLARTSAASGKKAGSPGTSRSRPDVPSGKKTASPSPAVSRGRMAANSAAPKNVETTSPSAPHLEPEEHEHMGIIIEGVVAKDEKDKRPATAEIGTNTDDEILVQERIRKMLLFAVAYSTNIGGTGSLVGTGPIKVFKELVKQYKLETTDNHVGITFATWMAFNLPVVFVNIFIVWLFLAFRYLGWSRFMESNARSKKERNQVREYLKGELKRLGPISHHEIGVLVIFVLVVVLWLLRDPQAFPGWGTIKEPFDTTKSGDSTAAMLGVLLLFIIPKDWSFLRREKYEVPPGAKYEALLNWKFVTTNAPWGYVLLIGSGFAIADASDKSGLSNFFATELVDLRDISHEGLLLIVMILTSVVTEGFSNTACANLILPVLFSVSCQLNIHPVYLTMAAAVSASYAFMLPISSPPNAIIFATGEIPIGEMLINGFILNVICIPTLFVAFLTYGDAMFHFTTYTPGEKSYCNNLNSSYKLQI